MGIVRLKSKPNVFGNQKSHRLERKNKEDNSTAVHCETHWLIRNASALFCDDAHLEELGICHGFGDFFSLSMLLEELEFSGSSPQWLFPCIQGSVSVTKLPESFHFLQVLTASETGYRLDLKNRAPFRLLHGEELELATWDQHWIAYSGLLWQS